MNNTMQKQTDERFEVFTLQPEENLGTARSRLPWVAFLGVDGSGKSSVLNLLRQRQDELDINRIHVFHRRPRLIHPAKGPKGLPISHYGKPNHNPVKSVFKLAALILDWHMGYLRQIRPLQLERVLVISDRHSLLDILADPDRYRYGGPAALVRLAMHLAPMPDVILLLDAPENVLRARKQELDPEQTARLRENYLRLYQNRPDCYVIDATRPLDVIVSDILNILKDHIQSPI